MRLAITRSDEALTALKKKAATRDLTIVSLPFLTVESIPINLPDRIDWVIFTSANGVRTFFEGLKVLDRELDPKTKIAAIGEMTAEAVAQSGHKITMVAGEAYSESFFPELINNHIQPGECVLYARAAEVSFDPKSLFQEANIVYQEVVCYRTTTTPVSPEVVGQLDKSDLILFTAPSTVRAYHEQFGRPVARSYAIGAKTMEQMRQLNWTEINKLERADIEQALEYI